MQTTTFILLQSLSRKTLHMNFTLMRTLKVAGAADANYYFHIITIPFP
nr:MAG TPA: hypothetical protein [Caudoviricetes sp.]